MLEFCKMSSDEYQVQNVYRYSRKSFKGKNDKDENCAHVESHLENSSPSSHFVEASCNCEMDRDQELASILHKKCPVILLAQQQLQRLLNETDCLLTEATPACRSFKDCMQMCKEILRRQNKFVLVFLLGGIFIVGLILGAATCGTCLGRYNSPVLDCLDNNYMIDKDLKTENAYRAIV